MKKWEEVEYSEIQGFEGYEFHEELSNGQIAAVYFQRVDVDCYNCAFCIMDNIEQCEKWCSGDTEFHKINGRCGLEGLVRAYRLIRWFIENRLPSGYKLYVHGEGKRRKAYRYLMRLGFKIDFETQQETSYVFKKDNDLDELNFAW